MKRYRLTIYIFSIIISLVIVSFAVLAILGTMVSVKFDTQYGDGCISLKTGRNLCLEMILFQILLVFGIIAFALLIFFRRKILKRD